MKKLFFTLIILTVAVNCLAVTSRIIRHKSANDFSDGKTKDTVVNSRGNITLAWATQVLAQDFNNVWIINSIIKGDDGTVYLGTSPNGKIYTYKDEKTNCIYPVQNQKIETEEPDDPNDPNAPKPGPAQKHLQNLHVFKLAFDSYGRPMAGISGDKAGLVRFNGREFETLFEPEPNDASYIFAVELDNAGNIFLGTGPKGNIWQLDKKGTNPTLIYTCKDKNVLCLAMGNDGFLYAGTDTRGLVYKVDPKKKTASILYDSDEDEITDLVFDDKGQLYAAATSYKSIKAQLKKTDFTPAVFSAGRPESEDDTEESESKTTSVTIPNSGSEDQPKETPKPPDSLKRGRQSSASQIYKIDPNGFVTKVFSQSAVFFALYIHKDDILLGTGNEAQMFSINPQTEIETLIYEDESASQITDIISADKDVYFCTANPAKLILLKSNYADSGTFESTLIDAGQPAQWGKLQLDADIPDKTKIMLSARSGNVDDVNDQTFSNWTEPVKITTPIDLTVPLGRFCQYKLTLEGSQDKTPFIREVAAAFAIPNLAPKVITVTVERKNKKADPGIFKIDFYAEDKNADKLTYKIEFRKTGRTGWIELEDELDKENFEWDSKTVEDGSYEIKVTASDELGNSQDTKLTGSRISDPVIVDNTPPVVDKHKLQTSDDKAVLELKVKDIYSVVDSLSYSVDSNEKWVSALPQDNIFDTLEEDFTITVTDLKPGPHVLAVKIADAENNTMYKTFDIDIK
ncbi:MAG: hypothetical protein JW806_06380 [Sedimentisphaerales bacterium]|nr:hypothetical protein [Sedimentisphaerales bacterium]